MDSYHVELSIVAFNQLKSIGDYITYTLLEADTSKRLIKGLRSSISNLSTFPYRYPIFDENRNIRCMPYKNYNIFYSINETRKTVSIHAVGYNRRNWVHILRF